MLKRSWDNLADVLIVKLKLYLEIRLTSTTKYADKPNAKSTTDPR